MRRHFLCDEWFHKLIVGVVHGRGLQNNKHRLKAVQVYNILFISLLHCLFLLPCEISMFTVRCDTKLYYQNLLSSIFVFT